MTAVFAEYHRSRELFGALVERQLRLRAKRTLMGVAWPILAPLFMLGLYAFVFNKVFNVPIEHYTEYLFCGLLPWSFLAQTLGLVIGSVSSEPELIRRAPFPYEYLPLSSVGVMALYFLATLVVFIGWLAVRGFLHLAVLPFLAVPILAVLLLVGGLAMILSIIDVYNHDLRLVLANLLTVWFFLVPIVYRPTMSPKSLYFLRSVDPMNLIVTQFRDVLYVGQIREPGHMVIMAVLCALLFGGALTMFRRVSRDLAKDV